jgi:hypothetical protein
MNDQITVEELEKASHNVRRLAEFVGERREWILASDAGDAAESLTRAARSLMAVIARFSGAEGPVDPKVRQPARLNPSGRVTASRLVKFAEFIVQLENWFSAHDGAALPESSSQVLQSIQDSLAGAVAAAQQLRGPSAAAVEPGPEPLISGDLGPVAEVDMTARLELDNIASRPLLQIYRGVTELTPEAISMIDRFFAKQGVVFEGAERRRFHDKVLKWIKGTPDGQLLVVRLSGLSGKVEAYSSYKPRGT